MALKIHKVLLTLPLLTLLCTAYTAALETRYTMKDLVTTLWGLQYAAIHELDITRRLLSSNVSASLGFLVCVLVARMLSAPVVQNPVLLLLRFSLAAFTAAYGFDICQQTMSVGEDKQNKPSRPIPAGLLSIHAAVRRWALSWTILPLALIATGAIRASGFLLCSFAWTYFCYVWPRPRHWFFKNLFTAVHQFFFVRLVDSLLVLHTAYPGTSIILEAIYSIWILSTIHVQDFHDVEGDRNIGRQTLPVALDESDLVMVRYTTALILVLFAISATIFGYRNSEMWTVIPFAVLQLAGAIATGLRLLRTESLDEAERTYKLFYVPTGLALVMYLSLLNPAV
jgi:4-hydroxybenzoate polyprenyltransferase